MVHPIRQPRWRNAQDIGNHHHSNRGANQKKGQHFVMLVVLVQYVVHFRDPIILKLTHLGLMSHPKVVYFYQAWGGYHRNYGWDASNRPLLILLFGRKNNLWTVTIFWDAGGSGKKHPTYTSRSFNILSINHIKTTPKNRGLPPFHTSS